MKDTSTIYTLLTEMQKSLHVFFDTYKNFNSSNYRVSALYFVFALLIGGSISILWTGLLFGFIAPQESYFENLSIFDYRIIEPLLVSIFGVELITVMIFANFISRKDYSKKFKVADIFNSISFQTKKRYALLLLLFLLLAIVFLKEYSFKEYLDENSSLITYTFSRGFRYGPIIDQLIEVLITPLMIVSAVFVYKRDSTLKINFNSSTNNYVEIIARTLLLLACGFIIAELITLINQSLLGMLRFYVDNWVLISSLQCVLLTCLYGLVLPGYASLFGTPPQEEKLILNESDENILDDFI